MKRVVQPSEGSVLKLGPPATGEIVIKLDPQDTGGLFVAGTETLQPGAEIPLHRHLREDELLFVHKGQGRATLEGRVVTVVPGVMVHVPKQSWHGLRNTGTGLLQILWLASPPGIEGFFRELSRLGPTASAASLKEVAGRYGIELSTESAPAAPAGGRPGARRHRGRRGRGRGGGGPPRPAAPQPSPQAVAPPAQPSAPPPQGVKPGRHRRRRRRGGRGRGTSPAAQPTGQSPSVRPPQPSPPRAPQPRAGAAQGGRRPRGRRHGRVKEVYMDGRWVRVVGEGPVIATGEEQRGRRHKPPKEEEGPRGPLSVTL